MLCFCVFFFKQKTAYEMRIRDWSSDVCSSDLLTDEFMEAVRDGKEFALRSPKDQSVRGSVNARALFQKLVEVRLATGEPYIVFNDTVNRTMPKHHRDLGLKVSTSNLCSEITLPTGRDHIGNDRTAVCCLSSLNLETWRSEEHTSELQSLMRISYAVFCLNK